MAHGWETGKPAFRFGRNSVLSLCSSVSFGVSFQSSRTDTTETNCLSASRISRPLNGKLVDRTRCCVSACQRVRSVLFRQPSNSRTPNSSVILRRCREFPLEIGNMTSSERRYADDNLLTKPEGRKCKELNLFSLGWCLCIERTMCLAHRH